MSNKELAIQLINQLPDYKLEYAIAYLQGLCSDEVWDSDFTKVTPSERKQINESENSGYISESEIDWDNLDKMNLD